MKLSALFGRPAKPVPLLSEAEMARLHEEIFEEPVSAEHLFAMYRARAAVDSEWVMDAHTLNRIRRALMPSLSGGALSFANFEYISKALPSDRLLGLPVVIEPFAKLAIRDRVNA